MKALGGMLLGVACAVLLLAAPAQAHKLTAKRAEAALQPAAAENTPVAAAKIATLLPGGERDGVQPARSRAVSQQEVERTDTGRRSRDGLRLRRGPAVGAHSLK